MSWFSDLTKININFIHPSLRDKFAPLEQAGHTIISDALTIGEAVMPDLAPRLYAAGDQLIADGAGRAAAAGSPTDVVSIGAALSANAFRTEIDNILKDFGVHQALANQQSARESQKAPSVPLESGLPQSENLPA